ncbi:hypothetical protein CTA2_3968 [Colletotrichum tanaceti]|uniref:Uncharacterized protein n=1 Tax=Colletotrichum tanaceti TaxID=1306861 RepID=A0A4U6XLV2_9PEZI|nr:hypothetical protein CTA2_3968 [Colletotrichum tanaceti]TKW56641.1 hypothetical protein CTA1_3261 [Colletotrichum tanaceti]
MSGVIHNNAAAAPRGFSISQPFLGAALQFYPEMGSQQLDDLINAYVSGSASILEKRATVSMDFFAYSQLTGETFKYYAVAGQSLSSTTSSAGSSPMQDSSYSSNFVSPVISDWSWSQSTPSSASVSTPASVTHEATLPKSSRKAGSSVAKSQSSDFSHLPGMKIMTKDGRDVTSSASRGCKTKEQRDHAHLMRIIKACDACKKKKVRCDPSHKKRTAAQSQGISTGPAPMRMAKKVKTSAKDIRAVAETSPHQNASFAEPSLSTELSSAVLDIPDMSVDLLESWESFVRFDDDSVDAGGPFLYDFFSDPAGHLTPESSQSSVVPSTVFAQPLGGLDALHTPSISKPFRDEPAVCSPTLPYLNSAAPANNYVDFNLYSPEPSFLDDDVALLTDIRPAIRRNQGAPSQHSGLAQSCQSLSSPQVDHDRSPAVLDDQRSADYVATSSERSFGGSSFEDHRCRSIPPDDIPLASSTLFEGLKNTKPFPMEQDVSSVRISHLTLQELKLIVEQSEPVSQWAVSNSHSAAQAEHSSYVTSGDVQTTQVPLPYAKSPSISVLQPVGEGYAIASRATSRMPSSSGTVLSHFSSSPEETTRYMQTATTTSTSSSNDPAAVDSGAITTSSDTYLLVSAPRPSESCASSAPLSSEPSATQVFGLSGTQPLAAMETVNDFARKRPPRIDDLSNLQLLIHTALLVATFGMVVTWHETQSFVGGLFQIVFGLAMYNANQFILSQYDSGPQQSLLGTTPKPQGFSNGARLLSCVSMRLRPTCRQIQDVRC